MSLRFPSETILISRLENVLSDQQYMKEKKIIQALAKAFANQTKEPIGVDMGVMLELYDLNIQLPEIALRAMIILLCAALKKCADK